MGANNSTEIKRNQVLLPRTEYLARLKEYEDLQRTVRDEDFKYKLLQKELTETKKQATKTEKSLELQLQEYKSFKILRKILDVMTTITKLDQEIKNYQNGDALDETTEIQNEIKQLKDTIKKLSKNIDKDMKNSLVISQEDMEQLEYKVKGLSLNHAKDRGDKFGEILDNLRGAPKTIESEIEKLLAKIHEDVEANRALFDEMRQNKVDPTYLEIKSVLMKQENVLLKYQLTTSQKDVPQKNVSTQSLGYNLIFHNVPERAETDYQQVRRILELLGILNPPHLTIHRVGQILPDKPRLVKVMFPTKELVRFVMENKYKLKGHSNIWITPDKYENRIK